MANKYLEEFYKLRCAKDVLDKVGSLNHLDKEITESISIIRLLRNVILSKPLKEYSILDLCAGNCLTSVLAAHLFPIKYVTAVDILPRKRLSSNIKHFSFLPMSIYDKYIFDIIDKNTIIISIHPCQGLAVHIARIYNNSDANNLFMMPCCIGVYKSNTFIKNRLGQYVDWCLYLQTIVNGTMKEDKYCLSDKKIIISAKKSIDI